MASSVLFVDQYADLGGGQRSLLALLQVALAAGFDTALLAPAGGLLEREAARCPAGTVAFHNLPEAAMAKGRKGAGDLVTMAGYSLRLLSALRRLPAFGVRYYNGPRGFLAGLLASRLWTGRSIFHVRIDHSRAEKMLLGLIVRFARRATVVFNSPYLRDSYARFDPAAAASPRVVVMENCLYPPYGDLPFEDRFTGRCDRLKAAVFGRVCPDKGQDRIVPAVRRCEFLDVALVGKCEEADRPYLDHILAEGAGRISHTGFVEDVPDFAAKHGIQLSIVPSRWNEAFGLVAIESMAMSCLTMVSDRGMLPDIAERTGAVCFSDEEQLVRNLQRVHGWPAAQKAETASAQFGRCKQAYSFDEFSGRVVNLLTAHAS